MIFFSKEQVYIVTGVSSGIGKETALILNELGATVIGLDCNSSNFKTIKQCAKFSENIFLEEVDLTKNIDNLPNYVKSLKEKYGKFSGMVYCAGISRLSPLKCIELEEINSLFSILYLAPIMMLKGLCDKRNNIGKGTSFVIMSSAAVDLAPRGKLAFSSAMSAVITACKCIAKENAPFSIRCNTISPTDIDTPMTASLPEEKRPNYPMGIGSPKDVAKLAIFLLSKDSKWITGQNYVVDCASF